MADDLGVRLNKKQQQRMLTTLRRAPKMIKQNIEKSWNNSALEFRILMQDKHLSGGTTATRLARRTSTLYNSLMHEVKLISFIIQLSVWFLDSVADYAPTHEFGDDSRNIPARMNMRKEWTRFQKKFDQDVENAMEEGLNNA